MSNKIQLQTNNTNLQALIDKANALPDAGSGSGGHENPEGHHRFRDQRRQPGDVCLLCGEDRLPGRRAGGSSPRRAEGPEQELQVRHPHRRVHALQQYHSGIQRVFLTG